MMGGGGFCACVREHACAGGSWVCDRGCTVHDVCVCGGECGFVYVNVCEYVCGGGWEEGCRYRVHLCARMRVACVRVIHETQGVQETMYVRVCLRVCAYVCAEGVGVRTGSEGRML